MRVLVAGGAGYIGSHMVRALVAAGHQPIVFDNLATGHRAAVVPDAVWMEGDLLDHTALADCFQTHRPDAVMHFSARSLVGESVAEPGLYYTNNVAGTLNLLQAMRAAAVSRFVFSSTAAVFGEPQTVPIPDDAPPHPINPYGTSKWMVERILADWDRAYGVRYVALRYFNAAGASPDGTIGEDHEPESHLIPLVLKTALGQRQAISVFGTDYPTADGTCIRDYIHVDDLCSAHLLALDYLATGGRSCVYNLGNGAGFSVREVIETARRVTGAAILAEQSDRRAGDPAVLVADSTRIRSDLGWSPVYPALEEIVAHAWQWHRSHPHGYGAGES